LQVPASPQHLNPAGIARRPNETKGEKESRPIHQGITNALIVIPACDFKLTEKTAFSAWGHLRKMKMNSAVYPPEARCKSDRSQERVSIRTKQGKPARMD
jgi:hypothetical protein